MDTVVFYKYLPYIPWAFVLLAAMLWIVGVVRAEKGALLKKSALFLAWGTPVLYATLLTYLQYQVWAHNELGRTLLSLPVPGEVMFGTVFSWITATFLSGEYGYFMFYVWGRFFQSIVLLYGIVLLVYGLSTLFLRMFPEGFSKNDRATAMFATLISGWPLAVVTLPVACVIALLFILGEKILKREDQTVSLEVPLLVAGTLCLLGGAFLVSFLGLSVIDL